MAVIDAADIAVAVGKFSSSFSKDAMKKLLSCMKRPTEGARPIAGDRTGALESPEAFCEEVFRIQVRVPEESICAATKVVASRFRDDVDDATNGAPILSRPAEGDDLEFLNQVLAVTLLRLNEIDVKVVEAINKQRAFMSLRPAYREP